MEKIVRQFISGENNDIAYILQNTCLSREFHKEIQRQVKNNSLRKYFYLITFTLKKDYNTDETLEIEDYIKSQMTRPALRIDEAYMVKELTKSGRPHWHLAVKSSKFIAKNRFNYYKQKFGNIDISKSTNKSLEESLNYINKDVPCTKII